MAWITSLLLLLTLLGAPAADVLGSDKVVVWHCCGRRRVRLYRTAL